jgi:tetratricopeptide (TPR) repeat protein
MFKLAYVTLLITILFLVSCSRNTRTESEETTFWNARIIDSSYKLLHKNSDLSGALRYFDSSLQQSNNLTVYPKAARYGLIASYHYFFTSNNWETARMVDSALAFYNTPELQNHYPRAYVGLLLFGGHIAYQLSHYSKANEYYFKAKKIAEAHLSPCEKAAFNYNIAMVLYRQQNYGQSMNYFKEAFSQQETCAPQTAAVVLQQQEIQSNIGLCLSQLKKYDSATIHFNRALQIAETYKDSLGPATMDKIYGVVYGNKAKVAIAENRLKEAEQLSLKSIALNDRQGYEMENAMGVKLQLAEVYGKKKDLAAMFGVLKNLKVDMGQANSRRQLEWNRLMASYYENSHRPDSALHFFKNYSSLGDSLAEVQKQLAAADVNRRLREREQDLQIVMLKEDQRITLVSLWVTIIISCMALVIFYLIYQNYRRHKKNLAISLALNEEIGKQKAARMEEAKQRHKLITEAVIRAQHKPGADHGEAAQ